MDVSEVLAKAWEQVVKAGLPPSLHEVAFREAVELLTGGRAQSMADKPDPSEAPGSNVSNATTKSSRPRPARKPMVTNSDIEDNLPRMDERAFFEKLHAETDVDVEKLEQVYYVDKGIPRIGLKAAQLGESLKDRMTTIAKLICIGRAVGYGEVATSTRVIRSECRRLRCLDDKNINKYLDDIDGIAYVGAQRDKSLKVRPVAERAFPGLIDAILTGKADGRDEQS